MPKVNLVFHGDYNVKKDLAAAVDVVRKADYDLPRDRGSFLIELGSTIYRGRLRGNSHLATALQEVARLSDVVVTSVADFCCGSGEGTVELAGRFDCDAFGFDILPTSIASANRRYDGNSRVQFKEADVCDFSPDRSFDVVTFQDACGTLADRVVAYGVEQGSPIVGGRFCCYHAIPDELPTSKSFTHNTYLRFITFVEGVVRDKVAENYVKPQNGSAPDLLSAFARDELGITEEELKRFAAVGVDTEIGRTIVDLNRVMKLLEAGYAVRFDQKQHVIIANRKS